VKINYEIPANTTISNKVVDATKYNDMNQKEYSFQERFALNDNKEIKIYKTEEIKKTKSKIRKRDGFNY